MKHATKIRHCKDSWPGLRVFLALALTAASLTSCSSGAQVKSAEGDIASASGYSLHYRIDVSNTILDPLGYVMVLRNSGAKPITFKPSPPDCTLFIDPDSYTPSIFQKEDNSGGFTTDQKGSITLAPGNSCTIHLPIVDLESPLRGSTHDCQLGIRRQLSEAEQKAQDSATTLVTTEPLRSKTFRISVP